MDVDALVKEPESKTLEFKRDLSSLGSILKTVVAFANTAGGQIIIGCSDAGELVGVDDIFKEGERIFNAIADTIAPPIFPEIEVATVQGKDLLIVKVAHLKVPYYIKSEGTPKGVYMRLGSTSRPAGPEYLAEIKRTTIATSFDLEPVVDLGLESLDFEKIEGVFKAHKRKIDQKKLESIGVLVSYAGRFVPSIGGLILFGKPEPLSKYFPDARVRCARFLGDTKSHILDRYDVEGTILDAIELVFKFVSRNTRLAAEFKGMKRLDIREYPELALREVLINALVHNDYAIQGSPIQVAIFDDRLEIQNPGMLPFGFTLEDLKTGVSRVRNKVIARVFYELGHMEAWGSGYKRCIEECEEGGYPIPVWQELGPAVRVVFYPHQKATLKSFKSHLELTVRQKRVLTLFKKEKTLSFREIYKHFKTGSSERTLKKDISDLRDK